MRYLCEIGKTKQNNKNIIRIRIIINYNYIFMGKCMSGHTYFPYEYFSQNMFLQNSNPSTYTQLESGIMGWVSTGHNSTCWEVTFCYISGAVIVASEAAMASDVALVYLFMYLFSMQGNWWSIWIFSFTKGRNFLLHVIQV